MTASRGRALIINIRDERSTDSSERRGGSEHDYYNLTKMFEKFGFIISELSGDKNWEAKVFHAYNHQPIFDYMYIINISHLKNDKTGLFYLS